MLRPILRQLTVPFLVLFLSAVASAQGAETHDWSPVDLEHMRQVQSVAMQDDYAYQQTAHLTDKVGPRLTGSPEAAGAVQYVADELRKLGLDVRLEKVSVPHWVRGEERAELISYPGQVPGTQQKIVVTALATVDNAPAPQGVTADVVVVDSFAELEALPREKVSGKIVVFNEQFDHMKAANGLAGEAYGEAVVYREKGHIVAAKKDAIAALVRSVGGAEFRLPHTGLTGYDPKAPAIPVGAVTAEDAGLMKRLTAEGPVRMHLVLTPKLLPNVDSYNVIADLKGSEHPEQVVIVSGHLDSWDLGTGALDDAAGIGISMEVAQLLKALKLQPKRTIRVVAWMAEEEGIFGGRAYFKEHESEVARHFAAIETDLGAGHVLGINVAGGPAIGDRLKPIADVLRPQGATVIRESDETGADISPLTDAGVPSFSPLQDVRTYFDYHHTAADTLDKINGQELRENAAAVAVLAYALAQMQGELPRKSK
jgi:Iap family predicted aminopeptidase